MSRKETGQLRWRHDSAIDMFTTLVGANVMISRARPGPTAGREALPNHTVDRTGRASRFGLAASTAASHFSR